MSCPGSAVLFHSVSLCISIGPLLVFDQHPNLYYTIFLPTSASSNDEYVDNTEKFMYQQYGLPVRRVDGMWKAANGAPLSYNNFEDTKGGDCAVIEVTGKWRAVDCTETYPVLMVGKSNVVLPSTCMSPGMLLYRFLCPGPVHGYTVTKARGSGCRQETFCYKESATYSDDCAGLPSADAYTRRNQDYNMLLSLNYVNRGNTQLMTTAVRSTDQVIENLGYCAPGPCIYGATFPIYWVQAIIDGNIVDNLYTASRDEALFLNVSRYPNGDVFMEDRYKGNYKGIVCYLWTENSSFNCSYCSDPTAVVIETSYVPWVMLLTVTFVMAVIVSSVFYKNSQSLSFVFLLFLIACVPMTDALNIPGDIIDILKPRTTSTKTTFPTTLRPTLSSSNTERSTTITSSTATSLPTTSFASTTPASTLMTKLSTLLSTTPITELRSTVLSSFSTEELQTLTASITMATATISETTTDSGTIPRSTTPYPTIDPCDKDVMNLLWFLIMLILFGRVGLAVAMVAMLVCSVSAQPRATSTITPVGETMDECSDSDYKFICSDGANARCCWNIDSGYRYCGTYLCPDQPTDEGAKCNSSFYCQRLYGAEASCCPYQSESYCVVGSCLTTTITSSSSSTSTDGVTIAITSTVMPQSTKKVTFVPPTYSTTFSTLKTTTIIPPKSESGMFQIVALLIIVYCMSRYGMSIVLFSLMQYVVADCTSSQAWIDSLCWFSIDLSNRPSTNIPIPSDPAENAELVANLRAAAAKSIFPYASCVYLPITSCSGGYCDPYGHKLSYLPITDVVPPGDYLSIVIDQSVEGISPGQWVAVKAGTYCSNYKTVFAFEEMSPYEILVILALLLALYVKAYYTT